MASIFPNNGHGLIAFYNYMFDDRGFKMPAHLTPVAHAIMDPRIDKLLVTIGPGSGKSTLISTVAPAFCMGQDPTLTQLGISAGEELIQGFQRGIMEWVADSERWRRAFPGVVPMKKLGWSTSSGMFISGHRPGDPDPSYGAFGLRSQALTGKHGRRITLDDIHNVENSSSAMACLGVQSTYYSTLIGRADPGGCKFIVAGRRWHESDLYGHLGSSGDWVHMNLPAFRDGEERLYWDIRMPKGLRCFFTD